jgi:hypothetical protein
MARPGDVCWSGCADLVDFYGVARRDTTFAMVDVNIVITLTNRPFNPLFPHVMPITHVCSLAD